MATDTRTEEHACVYAFGLAECGRLGVRKSRSRKEQQFSLPKPVNVFRGRNVIQVCCGRAHSFAVDADGGLWAWGDNAHGQLGLGEAALDVVPRPQQVAMNKPVLHVATAPGLKAHTLALCDRGVFSWGYGSAWQLGHHDRKSLDHPREVLRLRRKHAVRVDCGSSFSVVLTRAGEVLTWGNGLAGQLGQGDVTQNKQPTAVALPGPVDDITAGHAHVLVLLEDGRVFAWGANTAGQVGDGTTRNHALPVELDQLEHLRIVRLVAGHSCSFATNADGLVFTWGRSITAPAQCMPDPDIAPGLKGQRIKELAVTRGSPTLAHVCAVSDDGRLLSWGSGQYGQLGLGGSGTPLGETPAEVEALRGCTVAAVACGDAHTMVVTSAEVGDGSEDEAGNQPVRLAVMRGASTRAGTAPMLHVVRPRGDSASSMELGLETSTHDFLHSAVHEREKKASHISLFHAITRGEDSDEDLLEALTLEEMKALDTDMAGYEQRLSRRSPDPVASGGGGGGSGGSGGAVVGSESPSKARPTKTVKLKVKRERRGEKKQPPVGVSSKEQKKQPPVGVSSKEQKKQPPVGVSSKEQKKQPPVGVSSKEQKKQAPVSVSSKEQKKQPPVGVSSKDKSAAKRKSKDKDKATVPPAAAEDEIQLRVPVNRDKSKRDSVRLFQLLKEGNMDLLAMDDDLLAVGGGVDTPRSQAMAAEAMAATSGDSSLSASTATSSTTSSATSSSDEARGGGGGGGAGVRASAVVEKLSKFRKKLKGKMRKKEIDELKAPLEKPRGGKKGGGGKPRRKMRRSRSVVGEILSSKADKATLAAAAAMPAGGKRRTGRRRSVQGQ